MRKKELIYPKLEYFRSNEWLDPASKVPSSEHKLWLALLSYRPENSTYIGDFKHESPGYYAGLIRWVVRQSPDGKRFTRIKSIYKEEDGDEYTVVNYHDSGTTVERSYLNTRYEISPEFIADLDSLAALVSHQLIFNEKIGAMPCLPAHL